MSAAAVIISGGGTGGHLFPALAVGDRLKERRPGLRLLYAGSRRSVERSIMRRRGAAFIALPVEGIKGRGWRMLKTLVLLPWAMVRSLGLIIGFRPRLVVGVGGYSSGPVVLAAWLCFVPTLILEQNAAPGFTNRLLRRFARKAVVAFPGALPFFRGKGVVLGNPVREEFYKVRPKPRSEVFTLLIFGGSQGSRVLNTAVVETLPLLAADRDRLEFFHQTGQADWERVKEGYARAGFARVVVAPFFDNMAELVGQADLCLCRAGATTIAELAAARRAAILVPFAEAADNHQLRNARELQRLGAAEVLIESELAPELLAGRIRNFLDDRSRAERLAGRLEPLRTEQAADRIADLCFSLMKDPAHA
ncbi:MAG: undecaprenyldiphospho-muramoylpentapeptide beta-N-acetylglucosaminyltransferase [Candidatus Aminicenantes bacterium RBG_13_63_10]|nr:MAG: undecaprenyldiphospho-muramoylpentapeptide beta-N-acetylglucosaminyltransferase [Candidatus Aminicenantes bacterium RBG_13_63_10]